MKTKQRPAYSVRLEPSQKTEAMRLAKKCRWSLNTWIQAAVEEKIERAKQTEEAA